MKEVLSNEQRHWLELLKQHENKGVPSLVVPGVIRILLLKKRLARIQDGQMEITVEGIEELRRRA